MGTKLLEELNKLLNSTGQCRNSTHNHKEMPLHIGCYLQTTIFIWQGCGKQEAALCCDESLRSGLKSSLAITPVVKIPNKQEAENKTQCRRHAGLCPRKTALHCRHMFTLHTQNNQDLEPTCTHGRVHGFPECFSFYFSINTKSLTVRQLKLPFTPWKIWYGLTFTKLPFPPLSEVCYHSSNV